MTTEPMPTVLALGQIRYYLEVREKMVGLAADLIHSIPGNHGYGGERKLTVSALESVLDWEPVLDVLMSATPDMDHECTWTVVGAGDHNGTDLNTLAIKVRADHDGYGPFVEMSDPDAPRQGPPLRLSPEFARRLGASLIRAALDAEEL